MRGIGLATALATAIAIGVFVYQGGGGPADYFIAPATASPAGSDSNPGTVTAPFLTMKKCAQQQLTVSTVCELAAGTYSASQSLDKAGGTRTGTVTFRPAAGATVNVGVVATLNGTQTWTLDSVANDAVTVNMVNGTTADFPTGTSCAPVSSPCADMYAGKVLLRCPSATRTSTGWTGCNLADAAGATPVTFYTGAEIVSTGAVFVSQDFVKIKDINLVKWTVHNGPHDVTIENSTTKYFEVNETSGLTVKGGRYGNTTSCFSSAGEFGNSLPGGVRGSGVVFDGVTLENVDTSNYGGSTATGCHQELVKLYPTNGVTFKNCVLTHAGPQLVFIEELGGRGTDNLTFENCFIDIPWSDGNGTAQGGWSRTGSLNQCIWVKAFTGVASYSNINFRNDSFAPGCTLNFPGTYVNSKVTGSIFGSATCVGASPPTGFAYPYNVWGTAVGCGTNSVGSVSLPSTEYVDWVNMDMHLKPGATSIGKGNPGDFPATDIDGLTRTTPPDAGAAKF